MLEGVGPKRILLRAVSLALLVLAIYTPLFPISHAATPSQPISGVVLIPPTVQLFGHVSLVNSNALSATTGCYAVIELRDIPGKSVVVRPSNLRMQSTLEMALVTGNLVSFVGQGIISMPPPRGGTWNMDVYNIDEVTLYDTK